MKINYVLESIFIVQKKIKNSEDGKISDGHVSIEDYMVCERIWDKIKMKNMGDYHDHYLKKDVLLLADVFEMFIDTCLKYYKLDPCHYFSSPGLSWDAMLKITGVKLEKYLTLTSIYLLKKEQGEEFLIWLKDTPKQIINTCVIMTRINHQNLLLTWIKIIYMVGQ